MKPNEICAQSLLLVIIASISANAPTVSTFRVETSYAFSSSRQPSAGINRRLIWTRADIVKLQQQQEKQARTAEQVSNEVRHQQTTFRQQFRPKIVFSPSGAPRIVESNTNYNNKQARKIDNEKSSGEEEDFLEIKPPEVVQARRAVLSRALKFADEVHGPVVSTTRNGDDDRRSSRNYNYNRQDQARKLQTITTKAVLNKRGGGGESHRPDAVDAFQELGKGGAYEFGYQVNSIQTLNEHYRHEKRLHDGTVIGSYGMRDPDGRVRIVDYVADARGFRATIRKSPISGNAASPMTLEEHGNHVTRRKRAVLVKHKGEASSPAPTTSPAVFLLPPKSQHHHEYAEDADVELDHENAIDHGHGFDFTHALTNFRDPIPTTEKPQFIAQYHHQPSSHDHGHGHGSHHVEPPIITAEDLQKLQTSNYLYNKDSNRVVKVSVGVLAPSEFQNYAPLYPPLEAGEDLQSLIPPPPASLPSGVGQQSVHSSAITGITTMEGLESVPDVQDNLVIGAGVNLHELPPVPSSSLVSPPVPRTTPGGESRRHEVRFLPAGAQKLQELRERRRRLLKMEERRSNRRRINLTNSSTIRKETSS